MSDLKSSIPNKSPGYSIRIFLCHASEDKPFVNKLYHRLKKDGFSPWLDSENLIPGQDWQLEIPKAVHDSDVVIVCLSNNSLTKRGYFQKEIRIALDVADEQPDGSIFLIPLKLENCILPVRLNKWQWVNYFEMDGHERLILALETRSSQLAEYLNTKEQSKNVLSAPEKRLSTVEDARYKIWTLLNDLPEQGWKKELDEVFKALNEMRDEILRASAGGSSSERSGNYQNALNIYSLALENGIVEMMDDVTGEPIEIASALERTRNLYTKDVSERVYQRLLDARRAREEGFPESSKNLIFEALTILDEAEKYGAGPFKIERDELEKLIG